MSPVERPPRGAGSIPGSYEPITASYADWRVELLGNDPAAVLPSGLPSRAAVAVDAGCGPGLLAVALAPRVDRLLAFDASLGMVLATRRRLAAAGLTNGGLFVADATALPLRHASVDLVVACYLLHLTDLHRTLPSLAELLKDGGAFHILDSVRRWWLLGNSLPGWLVQAVTWPARVALGGRWRQARQLARMLWSPGWLRIHRQSGYSAASFAAACRLHLPGSSFVRTGAIVRVAWTARAADPTSG